MKNQHKIQGFALITLLITVAIIAILFVALYGKKDGKDKPSLVQTKNQAQTDLEDSNQKLKDYQKQLDNQ